jgi:hypothetical protein
MDSQILNISDIYNELAKQKSEIDVLQSSVISIATAAPMIPLPQSSNLIRNGTYSHSAGSWANSATADDRRYEAKYWFSHPDKANIAMQLDDYSNFGSSGTSVSFASGDVSTGADTVTITGHGFYTGEAVKTTAAAQPTGLSSSTLYWLIRVDANTVKFATSYANANAGTAVDITAAASGAFYTAFPLKYSSHTAYNPRACVWGSTKGIAKLNQGHTLDAQLFNFPAQPGFTVYAVLLMARANQYVHAPSTARITCGLYAKESTTWQYLQSSFTPTASVVGTVATPTSRDYRIHIRTDRGFTIQSSTLTVASAPSDTDFTNGARVILSWASPLKYGVAYADVYRKTGGTYVLLESIATGLTTYIDNNSIKASAGGYPSTDYSNLIAYSASQDNTLSTLAIDAVDPSWDTLPFALQVPSGYNLGLADGTSFQYVRWGITGLDSSNRFNVRVTDGVTDGTTTVTSAAAQFQTSGWNGKTITLTNTSGTVHTTTIASVASTTSLTLSVACPFTATSVEVIITGGGGDGDILVDLARLSYGENAIFSFNAEDLSSSRGVPVVFPNGSTTGGTGTGSNTGGGGDGIPYCVWEEEWVWTVKGRKHALEVQKDDWFISPKGTLNRVSKIQYYGNKLWRVWTENGCTAVTSDTHKYQTHMKDPGTPLSHLKRGDDLLTFLDGKPEISKITNIEMIGEGLVVKFSLHHGHEFVIGSCEGREGGIACVNRKPDPDSGSGGFNTF